MTRRGAALLGLVLALALSIGSAPAADAGLFGYETVDGVFTVTSSGANSRLVAGPESFAPTWSPNGTRLMYTRWDGLWVTRPDGSGARRLVRPREPDRSLNDGAAAWSPSGRRIAFNATRIFDDPDADDGEGEAESVWTVRSDGSHARRLRDGRAPAWILGGRRIAFTLDRDWYSNRIASMRADGSDVRILVGDARGLRVALAASTDGRRLLFLEYPAHSRGNTLRVLDLRSGKVRTFPWATTGPVTAATWSPNGTRIAFTPGPLSLPDRVSVFTIRPNATERRRLFVLPPLGPGISPMNLSWQPGRTSLRSSRTAAATAKAGAHASSTAEMRSLRAESL